MNSQANIQSYYSADNLPPARNDRLLNIQNNGENQQHLPPNLATYTFESYKLKFKEDNIKREEERIKREDEKRMRMENEERQREKKQRIKCWEEEKLRLIELKQRGDRIKGDGESKRREDDSLKLDKE